MSLTQAQEEATKHELRQALVLSGKSMDEVAADLEISPEHLAHILDLQVQAVEEPWILKEYLQEEVQKQGKLAPVFTALRGDFHDYWFLDAKKIEERRLGKE